MESNISKNETECVDIGDDSPPVQGQAHIAGPVPSVNGSVQSEVHLTDVGNGIRLFRDHGNDSRFCHQWNKWLFWDGTRWQVDYTGEAVVRAKATVKKLFDEAKKEFALASHGLKDVDPQDKDTIEHFEKKQAHAQKLVKHALKSQHVQRVEAMLKLARSEGQIPILPGQLDTHADLLNCKNGTLDLRTGQLRAHRREDLITKIVPGNFDPNAKCILWEDTLKSIHGDDKKIIAFLQTWFGYCATGHVHEDLAVIAWGGGSNGKTLELEAIREVLGTDYADHVAPDLLTVRQGERHPTELADLHGKRLMICAELDEGRRLNESLFKRLTGRDTIKGRRMREDLWSFQPTHKFLCCTNHKPSIRGTDHAVWRRIALVPYGVTFWKEGETPGLLAHKADPKLLETLLAKEREGILAWIVAGAVDYFRHGLQIPEKVRVATKEYRVAEDRIGRFTSECCLTGPDYRIRASVLYAAYVGWTKTSNEGEPMSLRAFGEEIERRGFQKKESHGVWYLGVALNGLQQSQESLG
jgi:putative DNA primase/helicase